MNESLKKRTTKKIEQEIIKENVINNEQEKEIINHTIKKFSPESSTRDKFKSEKFLKNIENVKK